MAKQPQPKRVTQTPDLDAEFDNMRPRRTYEESFKSLVPAYPNGVNPLYAVYSCFDDHAPWFFSLWAGHAWKRFALELGLGEQIQAIQNSAPHVPVSYGAFVQSHFSQMARQFTAETPHMDAATAAAIRSDVTGKASLNHAHDSLVSWLRRYYSL